MFSRMNNAASPHDSLDCCGADGHKCNTEFVYIMMASLCCPCKERFAGSCDIRDQGFS